MAAIKQTPTLPGKSIRCEGWMLFYAQRKAIEINSPVLAGWEGVPEDKKRTENIVNFL
jgi:hypothetical protein